MILRYFYDERLAQASYLLGCAKTGEALVIDPTRDVSAYVETAAREGLRITHVTETHIHADFVSGSRELAAQSGATIYLSDTGPADWKYGYADQPNVVLVRDGDAWMVGNIRLDVIATPGHTPEHISFLITDTAVTSTPIGMFSGDFIFAGDVGRPDLLEEAAGIRDSKEPGARQQFASLKRIARLPDHLQLWPGHGAGSACGKALGAIPSSTLGYERIVNPAFQFSREDVFVRWLLSGQPEAPRYFAQMKRVNKFGPALLATLPRPAAASRAMLETAIQRGERIFDLRSAQDFTHAHLPGSISLPATAATFSTYAGWLVDFSQPVHLIAPALDDTTLRPLLSALRAIGVDTIASMAASEVVSRTGAAMPIVKAADLTAFVRLHDALVLDVRGINEYRELHARDALHIPLGHLPERAASLPHQRPIVIVCASGYRSHIASSILRSLGFDNVWSYEGSAAQWRAALPVAGSDAPAPIQSTEAALAQI